MEVCVSSGLLQGQGLWVQQTWAGCSRLGYGISPLGEGAARTYIGVGKYTLGGHKQKIVHPRTQEEKAVTPQVTDPDLPMCVQESLAEA